MQNEAGKKAEGFCKSEMQAVFKYLVHPLLELHINRRMIREDSMQEVPLYWCGGRQVPFSGVVAHWKQQLQAAYVGLQNKAWHSSPGVEVECYKPTTTAYFLSFDNAPAHSLWINLKAKKHLSREQMPLSLLQLIRICPKGHDVHQHVEHSIGVIKVSVAKELCRSAELDEPLNTDLVWELVQDAKTSYHAGSWKDNLVKLRAALKVIAADSGEAVVIEYPQGHHRTFPGQAGNYAPPFLS